MYNKVQKILSRFLFLAFFFGCVFQIQAKIFFRPGNSSVYENNPIIGSLIIENEQGEYKLKFPTIPGLRFESSGKQNTFQSTNIINGTITKISRYTLQFYIRTDKPGTYNVKGISIENGHGKEQQIAPFQIRFLEIPENKNLKIEVHPLKTEFYPNEKIQLKLVILYNGFLEDYRIRFSLFDQAKSLNLNLIESYYEGTSLQRRFKIGNYELPFLYRPDPKFENRYEAYLSFRQTQSNMKIPPAYFEATYRYSESIRSIQDQALLKSAGFTIQHRDFPKKGKPNSFRGTVGKNFTLTSSIAKDSYQVNNLIPMTVRIISDDKIYDDLQGVLETDSNFKPDTVKNLKREKNSITYTAEIIALKEGNTELPAVVFSYFNPETGKYIELKSKKIPVKIIPAMIFDESDIYIPENEQLAELKNLKPATWNEIFAKTPHANSDVFLYSMTGSPFLSLFFLAGLRIRRTYFSPERRNRKKTQKHLDRQIAKLEKITNPKEFIEQFSVTFRELLTDRFGIQSGYFTAEEVSDKIGETARKEIPEIQKFLDEAHYAPQFSNDETRQLLQKLKKITTNAIS